MSSRVKSSGRVRRYGIFKWNEKLWVLVNGHIFANSDQVGGSTSTPTNPTFSISLAICIEAVWVCFADLLQTDLDKVKESWNTHWIRTSRNATVSSILDMMYFLPKEFGQNDCLIPVSSDKLIDMEIYIYWSRENWPRFCRVCSMRQRKQWFNLSKDHPWRGYSFWETNNICYGPFVDWLSYY